MRAPTTNLRRRHAASCHGVACHVSNAPRGSPGPAAGETLGHQLQLNILGKCIRRICVCVCVCEGRGGGLVSGHLLMSAMGCPIVVRQSNYEALDCGTTATTAANRTYHSCRDCDSAPAANANADGSGCGAERELADWAWALQSPDAWLLAGVSDVLRPLLRRRHRRRLLLPVQSTVVAVVAFLALIFDCCCPRRFHAVEHRGQHCYCCCCCCWNCCCCYCDCCRYH